MEREYLDKEDITHMLKSIQEKLMDPEIKNKEQMHSFLEQLILYVNESGPLAYAQKRSNE